MTLNLPLMQNNILKEDLDLVIEHLQQIDPKLTHGYNVVEFEKEWSEWLGVKYSVFVNSWVISKYAYISKKTKITISKWRRSYSSTINMGFRYCQESYSIWI